MCTSMDAVVRRVLGCQNVQNVTVQTYIREERELESNATSVKIAEGILLKERNLWEGKLSSRQLSRLVLNADPLILKETDY